MFKNYRIRYKLLLIFGLILISSNSILFIPYSLNGYITAPHDADRKDNGNTLITHVSFGEMLVHMYRRSNQIRVDPENQNHKIIEYDSNGNIVWEFIDVAYPHEVLEYEDGHIFVADTGNDRIIEIDYPDKNIVWNWKPALINWSKVNPFWDSSHYYNNPFTEDGEVIYDWTHVNDVEMRDYGTWEACLVSLRNFDLIVEINYTAEQIHPNQPENIVWWFGDLNNYDLLHHQHNPDYLENGNIIVADSENNRIVEIDHDKKEIIWEYGEELYWPRDADVLDDGTILITDSNDCEVLLIDKEKKEVIWNYQRNSIMPYEADMLDNGNILLSTEYNGIVIEVSREGKVVSKLGNSYIKAVFYLNLIILIFLSLTIACFQLKKQYSLRRSGNTISMRRYVSIPVLSLLIAGSLVFLIMYDQAIIFMVRLAHSLFGSF